jgi:cytidylate kinase
MTQRFSHHDGKDLEPAEIALKAAVYGTIHPPKIPPAGHQVFVTVSRQHGAGGTTFSHHLAERLNAHAPADWSAWDHELIQKVSAQEKIAAQIVEMVETRPHSWLDVMLQGISPSDAAAHTDEFHVYKRTCAAIRALANTGHTVIVGQGGRYVAADLPGGIHIRLVAPLEHRIRYIAKKNAIAFHEAAAQVEELDRNRARFFARYWPGKTLTPETFTMTLNAEAMSVNEMVDCVLPLVLARESVPALAV